MIPSPDSNHMRRYLHGAGKAPWALITGATGGMGEEWAYQLASLGFNIVAQGRNRTKLEAVRDKILQRKRQRTAKRRSSTGSKSGDRQAKAAQVNVDQNPHNSVPGHVEVELLVCEATVWPNDKLDEGLSELINRKGFRLTVLINNLGVQSEGYPRLEDLSKEEVADIVVANALFPAQVTRTLLPTLKRSQPSLLVTVTSIGAWTPTPYLSPYMGTKGFDVAFSHSLRNEMMCESAEVDVVCMVPGQVQSGMCLEPESYMVPTSYDWVRSAILSLRPGGVFGLVLPGSWLALAAGTPAKAATSKPLLNGFARPKGVITPWWPHYLGMLVAQYGPQSLINAVAVGTVSGLKQRYEEDLQAKKR